MDFAKISSTLFNTHLRGIGSTYTFICKNKKYIVKKHARIDLRSLLLDIQAIFISTLDTFIILHVFSKSV